MHDSLLILIAGFYIAFLTVFLIPVMESGFNKMGFERKFKELEQIKIGEKKEMKDYHVYVADRKHMRMETFHLRSIDNVDFILGVIIMIILILAIRDKARKFWSKRNEIRASNRLTSKWIDIKTRDTEDQITEDTC